VSASGSDRVSSTPPSVGATIPAARAIALAQPMPVVRTSVGYSSGVSVYSAPHAPSSANESSMPLATTCQGAVVMANR